MNKNKIVLSILFVLTLCSMIISCDYAGYPYYLRLDNSKPVFIIVIDNSGSNADYISSINSLAAGSRSYLLDTLYGGDGETMDQRFAIVDYTNGENWHQALMAKPSELYPEFGDEQDNHPNRIILFYGNGAGASGTTANQIYQECNSFVGTDREELFLYMGRLIITTPNDGSNYGPWAAHLINGTQNASYGYSAGGPVMANYGWGYTEYNPSSIDNQQFLDDLMDAIR